MWDLILVFSLGTRRGAGHSSLEGDTSCLEGAGSAASSGEGKMLALIREEWSPLQGKVWEGMSAEPTP